MRIGETKTPDNAGVRGIEKRMRKRQDSHSRLLSLVPASLNEGANSIKAGDLTCDIAFTISPTVACGAVPDYEIVKQSLTGLRRLCPAIRGFGHLDWSYCTQLFT